MATHTEHPTSTDLTAKLKYLELIQNVIDRMAKASFLYKGWAITLSGVLFAFAVVENRKPLVGIAALTTVLFWGLDAYYLWLERRFINLYNAALKEEPAETTFSMAIDKSNGIRRWLRTCLRPHLMAFYGTIMIVELIGIFVVRKVG